MKDRGSFIDHLNDHNMLGEVAEVGVADGNFMGGNLPRWKGVRYHAIDVWQWYDGMDKGYFVNFPQEKFDQYYNKVLEMQKADPRINVMKMRSLEAAAIIKDASLDWCFIDANHEYPGVSEDLRAWWPKVKSGGIFSGHDYHPRFNGLCLAVKDFFNEIGEKFSVTEDGYNWYIIKG